MTSAPGGPTGPGRSPGAAAEPAGPVRMTDVEALMWRLGEHDARLRSTMTLLVTFDRTLDRAELGERVARVSRSVPLLRRRVDAGLLGISPPRWEPDPDFSVDRHLRVARSRSAPDLGAVAEAVVAAPFPAGQPPWRAVLVPGPVDSLILHLHHSYTDGLGGVQLLAELFDLGPDSRGRGPAPQAEPEPAEARPADLLGGLEQDVRSELGRSARLAGWAGPWAIRSVAAAARRPEAVLDAVVEVGRALRTQVAAASGPASPVLGDRTGGVRLAALDLPVAAMRAAGRPLGATVTDVFVGGLLEGLARYHEKCAVLPPSLRLGIPISARGRDGEAAGLHNQLYGAALRGPLGPLDFEERTRLVHEMVAVARRQPWLGLVEEAAGLGARIPGAVSVLAAALRSMDVLASSVTGPPVPLYLGPARVEQMVPVGPKSGSALNATLLSYNGRAHIGLNIDPGAVADPAVLVDCIGSAFEEHLPAG